jgi:chromosome segregation ATPase
MRQLLTGPVPEGLKCDVKSLCRLSGVPRATLYRTYPQLKAEFEQQRGVEREAGRQPDARQAQIDRRQTENTRLRTHLASKDAELDELKRFRTEALSRLAAQHDELTTLRRQHPTTSGGAQIHALPKPR